MIFAAGLLLAAGAIGGCSDVRGSGAGSQASTVSSADPAVRVKAALQAAYVNDVHVDVFTEKGNVVLRGLVEDQHALMQVLDIAQRAAEGRKVIDELTIMKVSPH